MFVQKKLGHVYNLNTLKQLLQVTNACSKNIFSSKCKRAFDFSIKQLFEIKKCLIRFAHTKF